MTLRSNDPNACQFTEARREHVRPPLGQTAEGVACTREDPYFARKVVRPFAFEPGDEVSV